MQIVGIVKRGEKPSRKKERDPIEDISRLVGSRRFKVRLCPVCNKGTITDTWKEECTGCWYRSKNSEAQFI